MTIAPALLSVLLALGGGSGLRVTWLAPSIPMLAILALAHFEDRLTDGVLRKLSALGLVLAIVIPLAYAAVVPWLSRVTSAPLLRVSWPQTEIARALSAAWTAETGKPLKIVAGSSWAAGLVALNHPDRPSILTDGNLVYSPWIMKAPAHGQGGPGALVVWTEGRTSSATPELMALTKGLPIKEVHISLPRARPGEQVVYKYAVIAPQ